MSTPALPAPAPSLRARLLVAARVARLEIGRIVRGRGVVGRLCLLGIPLLLCGAGATALLVMSDGSFSDPLVLRGHRESAADQLPELAQLFRFFVLPIVAFVLSAEVFGNLFRAELSEKTLHHIFLSPVRRELAVLGKFAAGVLLVAAGLEVSWLAASVVTFVPFGPGAMAGTLLSAEGLRHLVLHALVLFLGAAAYGALFLFLGLVLKKPLHVGFLFWMWEWGTMFLPQAFKRVSIIHWLDALLPLRLQPESQVAQVAEPEPRWLAVLVLVAVTALLVTAAAAWARRLQLSYGEAE